MMRDRSNWRLLILLTGLLAGGAVAQEADPAAPGAAEQPVETRPLAEKAVLQQFWRAVFLGQPERFEQLVDFPFTVLLMDQDGTCLERHTFDQEDWPALRAELADQRPGPGQLELTIAELELQWLGEQTCLAVYNFAAAIGDELVVGRMMSLLVQRNGVWHLALTTVPS